MITLLLTLGCDSEPAAAPPADAPMPAAEAPADEVPTAQPHTDPVPPSADGWAHYGSPFSLTDPMPAASLLAAPEKYVDQNVLVEGRITDVCQKAGCWMVITDNSTTMRVLMKDHGFSVDKGGTGATGRIEGTLVAREIDPEFVAHLESESQNTADMPEKQAKGNIVYEINATGVAMKKAEG